MSSPSEPVAAQATSPSGSTAVIHDLGYRPYAGPRLGERQVARSLFVTGLRNAYGLGRSARSKALPMTLLGLVMVPALVLVGVLVQAKDLLGLDEHLVAYSTYPITTQLVISVFVASQAPALFSRDLRFGTITLYLARPLRRATYVLVRLASLTVATFLLIAAPLLLLYLGGLLADLPLGRETGRFLAAMVGTAVLAACLSCLAALVSALTVRRGLAVAAVIVVLLVSFSVVVTIQGISYEVGNETVGEVAGLLSPYTLANGLQVYLFDSPEASPTPPSYDGTGVLYVVAVLVIVAASIAALLARYKRVTT